MVDIKYLYEYLDIKKCNFISIAYRDIYFPCTTVEYGFSNGGYIQRRFSGGKPTFEEIFSALSIEDRLYSYIELVGGRLFIINLRNVVGVFIINQNIKFDFGSSTYSFRLPFNNYEKVNKVLDKILTEVAIVQSNKSFILLDDGKTLDFHRFIFYMYCDRAFSFVDDSLELIIESIVNKVKHRIISSNRIIAIDDIDYPFTASFQYKGWKVVFNSLDLALFKSNNGYTLVGGNVVFLFDDCCSNFKGKIFGNVNIEFVEKEKLINSDKRIVYM